MPAHEIARHARANVLAALADTRVVTVLGARQVGKSTLAQGIAQSEHPAQVYTLDDVATREGASNDPTGFIAQFSEPVVIDEIQLVPELLRAIKQSVDRDQRPGRFLLTGSANLLTLAHVSDVLTGRVENIFLAPFSQGELIGRRETFIDQLFAGDFPAVAGAAVGRQAYAELLVRGGYPEAIKRDDARRKRFFGSYVQTVLHRDLAELANLHNIGNVELLLRIIAAQASSRLSIEGTSKKIGLPSSTMAAHINLLETLFLVQRIPGWYRNLNSRLTKAPKLYVSDSGLLAYLLKASAERLVSDDTLAGAALENFVATEILKQSSWCSDELAVFHYRDKNGREIDLLLESGDGSVVAVEVKAAATVSGRDLRHLVFLRDLLGSSFKAGVVLYTGEQTVPFGDRLAAVPVCGLWS